MMGNEGSNGNIRAPGQRAPLLEVQHLTKTFTAKGKDIAAVSDVSFTLMRGERLGIIGESGSGKTTLVNLITRLNEPTGGRILLDGEDITGLFGRKLLPVYRKMQMVFQTPAESFDPRQTLGKGIAEGMRNAGMPAGEAMKEAKNLLVSCGLTGEFLKRYPHQVSGGQCQRAAIARALAVKPQLLICDEATSALDVTVQKEIMELLTRLCAQRGETLTILFISHDIALVQQLCSRVLVMYRGRIVEEGTPDEVIQNPRDAYTKKLIDSILGADDGFYQA